MAFFVTLKSAPSVELDADEHSIESAITNSVQSYGPEVVRFWKTEQVITGTHHGPKKRELVSVIPFAEVVLIERV